MKVLQTARQLIPLSSIDCISNSRSQGCTGLQSLVECLDHTHTVSDKVAVCNHARLLEAAQCHEMHLEVYNDSHGKKVLGAAEKHL